jgi:hypothetical protein
MVRYRVNNGPGVFDTLASADVFPSNYLAWKEYQDWLADGNVPDPPPPSPLEYATLPAQRTEALARLRDLAAERIANSSVFLHDGHTYAVDRDWLALLSVLEGGGPTRQVPDADGVLVTMNPAQFAALRSAIASRVALAVSRFAVLVTQINASPAPLTVDITTGWPA